MSKGVERCGDLYPDKASFLRSVHDVLVSVYLHLVWCCVGVGYLGSGAEAT